LEVTTDLPDIGPSPAISTVDRVELPSDALPSVPRGGVGDQDYDRQMRHLAYLEATVKTLRDELHQSCHDATQKASISAYEGQEVIVASLMGRHLGTVKRLLKSTIESTKNSGASSKLFVTSVKHALFNPQGKFSAIKVSTQIAPNSLRFGWCHRKSWSLFCFQDGDGGLV
jgi:hypothetical protein